MSDRACKPQIPFYGSSVASRAPSTLKELVRQDALGRSRKFTAKMVGARLGADKFRVAEYLDSLAKTGHLTRRTVLSARRHRMTNIYYPVAGRGGNAS